MCGLIGIVNFNKDMVSEKLLTDMQETISYRGPDYRGQYFYENVGLAHNRLAIIDTSEKANQPFLSTDGSYIIIYNGILYNFKEIRDTLIKKGHTFKTNGDTEVILNAYIEWREKALNYFNGVFSFAVLDKKRKVLFCCRDRYGARPLYYYHTPDVFIVGSELKVFIKHPLCKKKIDLYALKEYFAFQNIFSERTLLKDVNLLPHGHYMTLHVKTGTCEKKKYWDYDFSQKLTVDYKTASVELQKIMTTSITGQLVSDVPVGSYLSGGMDSSTLAAVSSRTLTDFPTFTGGFDMRSITGRESVFDETAIAAQTARYYKMPNYQITMNAESMPRVINELVYHNDDLRMGQCWQNYIVADLASKYVKVVLSGAGGDELFGGYPWRYTIARESKTNEEFDENYFTYWQRIVPQDQMNQLFAADIYREMQGYDLKNVYNSVFSNYDNNFENNYDKTFYFELKTFMQGLLIIEDKISMAYGLETRVPFLDNAIVDFVLQLPFSFKLSDDLKTGKKLFRSAVDDLLPAEVINNKKQGFSPPDENWYRKENMQFLMDNLLEDDELFFTYVNKKFIENILGRHVNYKENNRLLIWSLLNFKINVRNLLC